MRLETAKAILAAQGEVRDAHWNKAHTRVHVTVVRNLRYVANVGGAK